MNVARPLTKNIVLDCDARTARHVGDLAISQSTVSQSRQSRHKSRSAEATGTTGGRAGLSADASAADSSPQTQYVRQLGEKLVATIPSHYSWPFEFHVLAQKEVNAFALRGGPMFVNLGTITAASNEAELAGVMAHEMAHVYMQHSAKQAAKNQNLSMWADLAGALLSATTGGWIAQLSQMGPQVGSGLISQRFSRDDESQADAVGAIILYRAGYNPQALANSSRSSAPKADNRPKYSLTTPIPATGSRPSRRKSASGPLGITRPTPRLSNGFSSNPKAFALTPPKRLLREPGPATGPP
jgi:predicted Zn-dependent protease